MNIPNLNTRIEAARTVIEELERRGNTNGEFYKKAVTNLNNLERELQDANSVAELEIDEADQ